MAAGREESQAEEAGCRSQPRQGDVAGCSGKKDLTLTRLSEWARNLQARYAGREKQICFALRLSRSSFRYRAVAANDSALRLLKVIDLYARECLGHLNLKNSSPRVTRSHSVLVWQHILRSPHNIHSSEKKSCSEFFSHKSERCSDIAPRASQRT